MENGIVRESGDLTRDIKVITVEIRELCAQAQATALAYIVEIGRRLVEAKAALPHGEWGNWLREEVGFSQSSANNYMKLYEEYGDSQMTIFGATVNSQTIGKLPYSKALALLAVPASEREDFAEKVGAEDLSVKELERIIKERDAERHRAEELEQRAREAEEAAAKHKEAAEASAELGKKVNDLEIRLAEMRAEYAQQKNKAEQLKAKLDLAKSDPKIPPAKLEKIKKDAEEAAKKALGEDAVKELEKTQAALKKAEEAKLEAERKQIEAEGRLKEAEMRLKTAAPEINEFKVLFTALQEQATKCFKQLDKIRAVDPDTAEKLGIALKKFGEGLCR
ncbi:MAG: DUF3102 domain-containing protein [Clostridia bacterium]|nr:DUF3102 domain-containing protein [Clostridia bacterium]